MRTAALRRRCNKTLRPAFTILELVVVMVLAGIMIAIAINTVPRGPNLACMVAVATRFCGAF